MKPWLLNLLACPIDKHHPLEAYMLRWETTDIEKVAEGAGKPKKGLEDKYTILKKQLRNGTVSPPAIAAVHDYTGSEAAATLNANALKLIGGKPEKAEELDIIYSYLNVLELAEGLLFCPECKRWYPIGSAVDGIPELMPDELREAEKDLVWLKKWMKILPSAVIKDVKPFTLE
jgi:uncharacterized protein YbaR (Trm112 family)